MITIWSLKVEGRPVCIPFGSILKAIRLLLQKFYRLHWCVHCFYLLWCPYHKGSGLGRNRINNWWAITEVIFGARYLQEVADFPKVLRWVSNKIFAYDIKDSVSKCFFCCLTVSSDAEISSYTAINLLGNVVLRNSKKWLTPLDSYWYIA